MTLPTIERDKGGDYVTRTRLSDLETVETDADRRRNHNAKGHFLPGNDVARQHGAHGELTKDLKAIRDAVQQATAGAIAPEESREVARAALALYVANRRQLGQRAVLVLARVMRASVNDALAGYYTAKAAVVGFATEEGLAMLDAAHRCENRAERGMTTALAFAKVAGSKPPKGEPFSWLNPGSPLRHEGEDDPIEETK